MHRRTEKIIDHILRFYLVNDVRKPFKYIITIFEALYGYKALMLVESTCPYCLRQFPNKFKLYIHLRQCIECRAMMGLDVQHVIDIYDRIKPCLQYYSPCNVDNILYCLEKEGLVYNPYIRKHRIKPRIVA